MEDVKKEYHRMSQWLLIAVILYGSATLMAKQGIDYYPQIQTIFWKLGHQTIAAFFGYWVDRTMCRGRMTEASGEMQGIRRAIIVVGAMLAIALGM